jgi:hypothetical protein
MISLGGLFADLSVAMLAFIAWHLVDDPAIRQVLSSLVVFNSINTLVFNMNPILKLDGYFALSDAAHRRNWHTESFVALKSVRTELAGFRFGAAARAIAAAPLRIMFALASTGYKIWIIAFIAWQVLPKFLGLGLFVVAWGFVAMFLTPLLGMAGSAQSRRVQGMGASGGSVARRTGWLWVPILGLALGLIALVPRPYHVTVPLSLDLAGHYAVRAEQGGVVRDLAGAGAVDAGDLLVRLDAPGAVAELALAQAEVQFDVTLAESTAGLDPLTAQAARQRAITSAARVARLQQAVADRDVYAMESGLFRPTDALNVGVQLAPGRLTGYLLPRDGSAQLIGPFPEIWVEKLREGLVSATLRRSDGFETLEPTTDVRLKESVSQADGVLLAVESEMSATALAGEPLAVRLRFEAEPLWRHAVFRARLLVLRFREAQQAAQGAATQ